MGRICSVNPGKAELNRYINEIFNEYTSDCIADYNIPINIRIKLKEYADEVGIYKYKSGFAFYSYVSGANIPIMEAINSWYSLMGVLEHNYNYNLINKYLGNIRDNINTLSNKIEFRVDLNTIYGYINQNNNVMYCRYKSIKIPSVSLPEEYVISLYSKQIRKYAKCIYVVMLRNDKIYIEELRYNKSPKEENLKIRIDTSNNSIISNAKYHKREWEFSTKIPLIALSIVNNQINSIVEHKITLPNTRYTIDICQQSDNTVSNNLCTNAMRSIANDSESKGHHSSPKTHLRREHVRTYKNGKQVVIKPIIVNKESNKAVTYQL